MAGGKLSPRQMMINMMYLVLTALLALNVSKEILNAFVTVNDGLEITKATFKNKMDQQYADFAASYNENKQKVGPYYNSAQSIQNSATEIIDHINNLKVLIIAGTEGKTKEEIFANDTILSMKYVDAKDAYDLPTNMMIGTSSATPKDGENTAKELKQKLEAYRDLLKKVVTDRGGNPTLIASLDRTFDFPEKIKDASGTNTNWESLNFYHVPLAACVTIMSKFQADIRNTESDVVNWLYSQVDASSLKFTDITPAIIPVTNYVTQGDTFRAKVFLAAYDATNAPGIYIAEDGAEVDTLSSRIKGASSLVPIVDGLGELKIPATGVGQFSKGISIKYKPMGQDTMIFHTYATYEVAKPSLVVSPTKMNVFYKGVDNPVEVSVPGFSADKIKPSISTGSIQPASGGGYIVKVKTGTKADISVTAELPDGSTKRLGPAEFRVKSVPNPTPYFAGKSVGDDKVKKNELTAAQGVIAKMLDFDFDLKFTVTQFKLTMIIGGTPIEKVSKSNRISGDMKEMLKKAKRGQKVYIENIKARGPDGTVRSLGSLSFKVT